MTIYRNLTNFFSVLSILLFLGFSIANAQSNIYTIEAGTKFRVKMDNEINSKVSSVNDTFTVTIKEPVVIRNVELIPTGSIIEGKILRVKPASAGNTNGHLEIKFQTLRLPNEVIRNIDASLANPLFFDKKPSSLSAVSILGGAGIGTVLGAMLGRGKGAIIGAGIGAGLGTTTAYLKKGKEAQIKANEEFEIRLNKEVALPVRDF